MAVRVQIGVFDDVLGVVSADNETGFTYEGAQTENLQRMVMLARRQMAVRNGDVALPPEAVARALPAWVRGYTWAKIMGEERQP